MGDVVAIIAVRMGSTRLPGKALLPILGRPMLARMIERVRRAELVERIVLATSTSPADDAIEGLVEEIGDSRVHCYRGSEDDVLGRLAAALRAHPCATALQLLGDNPLIHCAQVDAACRRLAEGDVDFVVTTAPELPHLPPDLRRFPIGLRVEAFSPAIIERCARLADEPYYREHATSFVHRHSRRFRIAYLEASRDLAAVAEGGASFAVNLLSDYLRVKTIFERLYPQDPNFPLTSVAALASSGELPAFGDKAS